MAFQIIIPDLPSPNDPEEAERKLKHTRERLDFTAQDQRKGWKGVQLIGQDMFGKTKGYTIRECRKMLEEVKKRREEE